jgi:hypothetical protein
VALTFPIIVILCSLHDTSLTLFSP